MSLHPTSELVAVGWLKGVTGIGNNVATQLPADNSTWSASGFTVVTAVGGSTNIYVPVRTPAIGLNFWAISPGSTKAPFYRANQLAECVRVATEDHRHVPRTISSMPVAYNHAQVQSAWLLNEPRRVPGDQGDYAQFTVDMAMIWIEVPA